MNASPSSEQPQKKKLLSRRNMILHTISGLIWAGLGARELHKRREQLYFLYLRLVQDPDVRHYDQALRFAEETLGTQIYFSPGYGGYTVGETVAFRDRRVILIRLLHELYKLPHGFFQHTQLPTIRFVVSLHGYVQDVESERRRLVPLGGLSNETDGTIFIAVTKEGEDRLTYALHHELFHALHSKDIRESEGNAHWQNIMDRYHVATGGKGLYRYREMYSFNAANDDEDYRKHSDIFITGYGRTSLAEDMAEFAETLLSRHAHSELLTRCTALPEDSPVRIVLEEKISYIKRKYFEWSNGSMNDAYWEAFLAPDEAPQEVSDDAIVIQGRSHLPPISGYQRFDPFYELTPAEQKAEMDRMRQSAPHLFPYEQEK